MNKNVLLAVIQSTDSEIAEAEASFSYTPGGSLDVVDQLPYLVMVRRAYRAGFYTDTLPEAAKAVNSEHSQPKPKRQPKLPPTTRKSGRRKAATEPTVATLPAPEAGA